MVLREKDLEATAHLKVSRDGGKTFRPLFAEWQCKVEWERTERVFTAKGDALYVIEFEHPGQTLTIPDMPLLKKGTMITLLGTTAKLKWKQAKDGTLTIDLSSLDQKELNAVDHAWVLKISNIL